MIDTEEKRRKALELFDRVQNRPERKELMDAIDSINHRYGPKTVKLSVEGGKKEAWMVKHDQCGYCKCDYCQTFFHKR